MMEDLPLGAHLTSPRRGYVHHGIYAGAGRVIHYAGFDRAWRSGPIEEIPIERFTRGHGVQVKAWAAPRFSGDAAIARARARLRENHYSFFANNCEHFAQWCLLERAAANRWTRGRRGCAARCVVWAPCGPRPTRSGKARAESESSSSTKLDIAVTTA